MEEQRRKEEAAKKAAAAAKKQEEEKKKATDPLLLKAMNAAREKKAKEFLTSMRNNGDTDQDWLDQQFKNLKSFLQQCQDELDEKLAQEEKKAEADGCSSKGQKQEKPTTGPTDGVDMDELWCRD